jgi:DNA-binding NtrC family response regulator
MSEIDRKDSVWDSRSAKTWPAISAATFDSREAGPTAAASKSSSAPASTKASVLIVEDDRSARRAITRLLRTQGFAVCEAGTLADAIDRLAPRPPDWILLDLMLPDGCGTDLLHKLRVTGIPSKTCVITGCGSERINEARRAGAAHVFTKPLDVECLMTVLNA